MKQLIKFSFLITILVMGGCNDKQILVPADGPKLKLGDYYHGGIVIFLDGTQRHGIVAMEDPVYASYNWAPSSTNTGATLTGIYDGASNTNAIIYYHGTSTAAGICDQQTEFFGSHTYSDWYLPSRDELDLIFQNRTLFEYPPSGYYWSSTEAGSSSAWAQDMYYGSDNTFPKSNYLSIKPVRKF